MDTEKFVSLIKSNTSNSELDQYLGLKENLKSEINTSKEAYADGLTGAEALYTDYRDLLNIHHDLIKRGIKSFADLGAGNCRSKILFDLIDSPFQSIAYEFVPERIQEAKKTYQNLGLKDSSNFKEGDLKDQSLNGHDAFFLYLPVGPTIEWIIEKVKHFSLDHNIYLYVIESHGDLLDYLNDHLDGLELLEKLPLHAQRHCSELHIYKVNSCAQQIEKEAVLISQAKSALEGLKYFNVEDLQPREKLYLFKSLIEYEYLQLKIVEEDFQWLACLKGWRYGINKDTIETVHPYRIHHLEKITSLVIPNELILPYVKERRDHFKPPLSSIRKIKISPSLGIERANGVFEEIS